MFVHVRLPRLFEPHLRALFIQFVGGSTRESISRVSIATLPRVLTLICAVFFVFFNYHPCAFTMAPKKSSEANRSKRKSVRTTIELKKELIAKHESGTRVSDLAAMFELPKSTVCTILKNKEAIKARKPVVKRTHSMNPLTNRL